MHFLLNLDILKEEIFILWVLFMTTNAKQTTNYKQIFRVTLIAFIGLFIRCGYLKLYNVYIEYNTDKLQKRISEKETELNSFSDKAGYDKLQYVKTLEKENVMMPWSDHVNAIMKIFDDLLAVDKSDTFNIEFSDFEISLEQIRLHWHVTNLRILYQWVNSSNWLISKFEELDFLDNISIKTYEKSQWELWYDFTLTANVINNGK